MIHGDGSAWLPHFRNLAERLAPHIVAMVRLCAKPLGTGAGEDAITRALVVLLTRHPAVRRIARVEYHFEPFRCDDDGRVESLGEIDFVAWAAGGWPRDAYLAYECKRLNATMPSGWRSLAPEYVKDGVHRFVTEQYSEELPFACMLGYVLDGCVSVADQETKAAIRARAPLVGLASGPTESVWWQTSVYFSTAHARPRSQSIVSIQHSLVSCV